MDILSGCLRDQMAKNVELEAASGRLKQELLQVHRALRDAQRTAGIQEASLSRLRAKHHAQKRQVVDLKAEIAALKSQITSQQDRPVAEKLDAGVPESVATEDVRESAGGTAPSSPGSYSESSSSDSEDEGEKK